MTRVEIVDNETETSSCSIWENEKYNVQPILLSYGKIRSTMSDQYITSKLHPFNRSCTNHEAHEGASRWNPLLICALKFVQPSRGEASLEKHRSTSQPMKAKVNTRDGAIRFLLLVSSPMVLAIDTHPYALILSFSIR